jgi:hypothetical protein
MEWISAYAISNSFCVLLIKKFVLKLVGLHLNFEKTLTEPSVKENRKFHWHRCFDSFGEFHGFVEFDGKFVKSEENLASFDPPEKLH